MSLEGIIETGRLLGLTTAPLLARRLKYRADLTTDGHRPYLEAVRSTFGADIDYAMLIKLHGAPPESETPYSPSECISVQSQRIQGNLESAQSRRAMPSGKISRCAWPCPA